MVDCGAVRLDCELASEPALCDTKFERLPLMHITADRKREKERVHLIHAIVLL